jgi:predicted transcriptional regulator
VVLQKRSSLDILMDVLRQNQATKTSLRYAAGMNHTQGGKYLAFMVEHELLEMAQVRNGVTLYQVTEKGKRLLTMLGEVRRLLREDSATGEEAPEIAKEGRP